MNLNCYQRGWNQKRAFEALCCDRSKVTSSYWVFNLKTFPYNSFCCLVLGKSRREVGNFWRRLLFDYFLGSCSSPVGGRDGYIFLLLLLKFTKVVNQVTFCSFFSKRALNQQSTIFILSGYSLWFQPFWLILTDSCQHKLKTGAYYLAYVVWHRANLDAASPIFIPSWLKVPIVV